MMGFITQYWSVAYMKIVQIWEEKYYPDMWQENLWGGDFSLNLRKSDLTKMCDALQES